jgi:hypothetical protein
MGLIYCDVHGEQGIIPSISLSLFDIIFSGVSGKELDIHVVKCVAYNNEEFLAGFKYFLSSDEFCDKGIKYEYLTKTEKDELLFDEIIPDCTCVCLKCFQDFVSKNFVSFYGGSGKIDLM